MSGTRTIQERLREGVGYIQDDAPTIASELIEAAARIDALEAALNPSAWTKEMSAAWHLNIPDTQRAFYALYRAALHPSDHIDAQAGGIGIK